MRIRFNDKIYFCNAVSYPKGSKLLIITTPNGLYTVDMVTKEKAESAYNDLLINGYYDVSEYEYSN
jgi:hypothetical protein